MRLAKDSMVTLAQRVTTPDGSVVDDGEQTIEYLHGGYDDIFAKIEQALEGKRVGDTIRVRLEPAEAFGDYDASLVQVETLESFDEAPRVGDILERQSGDADPVLFRVTEVADGKVALDGNHPFAGLMLDFAATVKAVRPATRAEIAAKRKAGIEAGAAKEAPSLLARIQAAVVGLIFGFKCRYRSEAHRLCATGPIYLIPLAGYGVWSEEKPFATLVVAFAWFVWIRAGGVVIDGAIGRWGEKFLFFDFSPNLQPSRSERIVARSGQFAPIILGLVIAVVGLFDADNRWEGLGLGVFVAVALSVIGAIMLPFLIMVLTGFRLRPVVDEPGN